MRYFCVFVPLCDALLPPSLGKNSDEAVIPQARARQPLPVEARQIFVDLKLLDKIFHQRFNPRDELPRVKVSCLLGFFLLGTGIANYWLKIPVPLVYLSKW